jgi:hypothetical protein
MALLLSYPAQARSTSSRAMLYGTEKSRCTQASAATVGVVRSSLRNTKGRELDYPKRFHFDASCCFDILNQKQSR